MTPDPVPTPRETWHFPAARVGRRVLVFDEVGSTNTVAAALARDAAPDECDGLAVVALNQTAGRGRFGRVWRSREGSSLLLSVVLVLPPDLRRPVVLTALAAVSVADAVYALTGVQAKIKWPNDVLIRGKKVCGVLIEQAAVDVGGGGPQYRTVVGIGLNLNQTADEFAAAGLPDATSLAAVTGRPCDLRTAAGETVRRLDAEYARLRAGELVALEAEWKWRTGLLGRRVVVTLTHGGTATGRLCAMSFDRVELTGADGSTVAFTPETVEQIREVG